MAIINPHINFNGNAEEAFNFYKSVFGGDFQKIVRFKEISSPEHQVEERELNKIMTITLPIGKNLLIGNDVPESMGRVNEKENRSKISITADSQEEASTIFKGLSEGGDIEISNDNNDRSYFAMFRDKYGIEWIVSYQSK
jgi:PhnB protein